MVSLTTILAIIILVIDFAISIWNAYAGGYNIGILRKQENPSDFTKAVAWSGVGIAFTGITYVMLVVLSFVALFLGYIDTTTASAVLGFDQLVFGLLIIGFGLMITIQSILIAAQRKNIWSIVVAAFNTIIEIVNIFSYIATFQDSVQMVKGISGNRQDEQNLVILVILAILIGYFITHAAYKRGLKKAEGADIGQQGRRNTNPKLSKKI